MFKLISYLWKYLFNFLRDLLTVVGSIVYVLLVTPWVLDKLSDFTPIIRIVILSLFVLTILFLLGILRTRVIKWKDTTEAKEVEDEIEKIKETANIRDFNTILPSEKAIRRWARLSDSKAKQWSSDAMRADYHITIMKSSSTAEVRIFSSMGYISKWKKESLSVYFGSGKKATEYFRELESFDTHNPTKLLFEYPNWRKAVIKAFEKINTQKLDRFHVMITTHETYLGIWLGYTFGKVGHSLSFEYNGKTLVNLKDKTKIKIL